MQQRRCCESCFQHLRGTARLDENVLARDAKQSRAKENCKSNSCEFHLVASGRELASGNCRALGVIYIARKVNGDSGGRKSHCGCKQCNRGVMRSPGRATAPTKILSAQYQSGGGIQSLFIQRPFPLSPSIRVHISARKQISRLPIKIKNKTQGLLTPFEMKGNKHVVLRFSLPAQLNTVVLSQKRERRLSLQSLELLWINTGSTVSTLMSGLSLSEHSEPPGRNQVVLLGLTMK